ncbi:TPA: hypothetical protein ACG338_003475 [Escherichia coli]
MKDYIKKAQENETIIDGGKVYDELRRDYLNRSFLFPCSDEKTDDNFNPFSDEAYIKMKSLHDERDNINFKNKMKEIKRNLSTSQKKEVEKIMKNKIKQFFKYPAMKNTFSDEINLISVSEDGIFIDYSEDVDQKERI